MAVRHDEHDELAYILKLNPLRWIHLRAVVAGRGDLMEEANAVHEPSAFGPNQRMERDQRYNSCPGRFGQRHSLKRELDTFAGDRPTTLLECTEQLKDAFYPTRRYVRICAASSIVCMTTTAVYSV